MERLKSKLGEDELVLEVANVVNKSIVALGTDEAFALRDNDGEIRAFKQKVRLTAAEGTLIQPVPNGPYVVSAQGYEVLSEAAGACTIFPTDVLVDGQIRQNPYVMRDTQNGRILNIYARAISFRFSSKGLPQVCDWTTIFDTPSYRMIDLLGKAKKTPGAFRLLPAEMPAPKAGGASESWARYPFDEATNLWINTSHEEALQWYGQILNREKKSLDFAQTFARRNSLKHLLGVQKAPGPVWDVPVLCWRPTAGSIVKWDATQYIQLQGKMKSIIKGTKGFDNESKQIAMQTGAEAVEHGTMTAAIEHETGIDDLQGKDLHDVIDITPTGSEPPDVGEAAPAAVESKTDEPPAKTTKAPSRPKKHPTVAPTEPPPAAPPVEALIREAEISQRERSAISKSFRMAREGFPIEYQTALKRLGLSEPIPPEKEIVVVDTINRLLDENV